MPTRPSGNRLDNSRGFLNMATFVVACGAPRRELELKYGDDGCAKIDILAAIELET